DIAHSVAVKLSIDLQDGVYLGCSGPTYETPAEIRAFKTLGADAVGMSTVPEVIIAAHSGMKVLGISAITNFAAGFQSELNHEEVVEVTQRIKEDFKGLVTALFAALSHPLPPPPALSSSPFSSPLLSRSLFSPPSSPPPPPSPPPP
ncbi:hypothetical protein IAG15_17605, partial [Enterococcus faecalis]|nr:hypothetical protein [Enterococcus faecalis]